MLEHYTRSYPCQEWMSSSRFQWRLRVVALFTDKFNTSIAAANVCVHWLWRPLSGPVTINNVYIHAHTGTSGVITNLSYNHLHSLDLRHMEHHDKNQLTWLSSANFGTQSESRHIAPRGSARRDAPSSRWCKSRLWRHPVMPPTTQQ